MEQWEVAKCGGVCAATGRELAEGEEHWAVLFEDGESFRREDYALEAWEGPPEGAFCFFKTRVPFKEKKKRLLVDDEVLINFFTRLASEPEETRVHFRFVLALILMRKRLLKYEETDRSADAEVWIMRLARDKEGPTHRVVNPRLNDEQIERVSRELGAILHGDVFSEEMAEIDELAAEDAAEAEREQSIDDPEAQDESEDNRSE
ncbi:MAG TPA: hypothetical protein P5572_02765 [Phycisphaerae bacterium]|nr:hypothetical protein [Phycisphaerae bacterium]